MLCLDVSSSVPFAPFLGYLVAVMSNFVVCAFYTPNYRDEVERLEISLKAFDQEYHLQEYDRLPTWEQNTGIKPKFLLECLHRFEGKDILYLDADAFIRRSMDNSFDQFEGDIGLHFNEKGGSHAIRTGTIYLRNTPATREFMLDWIDAQTLNLKYNDQDSFEVAYKNKKAVTFFNLPVEYVKIFDRDDVKAYVEHFQASRRSDNVKAFSKQRRKKLKYLGIFIATNIFYLTLLALNS